MVLTQRLNRDQRRIALAAKIADDDNQVSRHDLIALVTKKFGPVKAAIIDKVGPPL
jgi:hypothetical protein